MLCVAVCSTSMTVAFRFQLQFIAQHAEHSSVTLPVLAGMAPVAAVGKTAFLQAAKTSSRRKSCTPCNRSKQIYLVSEQLHAFSAAPSSGKLSLRAYSLINDCPTPPEDNSHHRTATPQCQKSTRLCHRASLRSEVDAKCGPTSLHPMPQFTSARRLQALRN